MSWTIKTMEGLILFREQVYSVTEINLKSLQQEKGITIISVSHHHNFLTQADEVYELKKGQGLCRCELKIS